MKVECCHCKQALEKEEATSLSWTFASDGGVRRTLEWLCQSCLDTMPLILPPQGEGQPEA